MEKLVGTAKIVFLATTIEDGNFAVPTPQAPSNLHKKYAGRLMELCQAVGVRPRSFCVARVAHTSNVRGVHAGGSACSYVDSVDSLVTDDPGVGLVVTGADCPPVLIHDPENGIIGLAHSGRESTLKHIVTYVVSKMRTSGAGRKLEAYIGPGICGGCYEVNQEIARAFSQYPMALGDSDSPDRRYQVDLRRVIESQLREFVDAKAIQHIGGCTYEQPNRWHSFRRDTHDGMKLTRPRVQAFIAMRLE